MFVQIWISCHEKWRKNIWSSSRTPAWHFPLPPHRYPRWAIPESAARDGREGRSKVSSWCVVGGPRVVLTGQQAHMLRTAIHHLTSRYPYPSPAPVTRLCSILLFPVSKYEAVLFDKPVAAPGHLHAYNPGGILGADVREMMMYCS